MVLIFASIISSFKQRPLIARHRFRDGRTLSQRYRSYSLPCYHRHVQLPGETCSILSHKFVSVVVVVVVRAHLSGQSFGLLLKEPCDEILMF